MMGCHLLSLVAVFAVIDAASADNASTVTIYWTRHGLSCANLHAMSFGGRPRNHSVYWKELDPVLSDCGAYQAAQISQNPAIAAITSKLDGVFSSSMVRTMQTANLVYGGPVTPLPFISEVPNDGTELAADGVTNITDHQDYPLSIDDQERVLEKLGVSVNMKWMRGIAADEQSASGGGRVQWRLSGRTINYKTVNETWVSEAKLARAQHGMGQFMGFLHEKLLPTLANKPSLHIAIADHGTFMGENFHPSANEGICQKEIALSHWGPHVNNVQVLAVEYTRSKDGLTPVSCGSPFKGASTPRDICSQDFASCYLDGKPIEIVTGQCLCKPPSLPIQV